MMKKQEQIIKKVYDSLNDSLIGLWIIKNIKGWILFVNFYSDFKRFFKWSSASNKVSTQANLRALITMDYHRLEKGLALKQPRKGFGKNVIKRLSNFLPEYQKKYGSDESVMITLNALQEYYDFNLEFGLENETNEMAYKTISQIKNNLPPDNHFLGKEGGTKKVKKADIQALAKIYLTYFFTSRYSVVQFTNEEVELSLI
ncbi:hypothetical protein [Dapis sp. BLCC M172]|uniref:hypothetical protein n=1 Tax=Dapis sp. BLCC M172 TaxID=2975281 RepID=UPI003CF5E336